MRCWPCSLTAASAPATVCSHAAASTTPTPFGAGQMSLLVSFAIHSSWLGPQVEPAASVISAADWTSSRAYAQPRMTALSSATVVDRKSVVEEKGADHED